MNLIFFWLPGKKPGPRGLLDEARSAVRIAEKRGSVRTAAAMESLNCARSLAGKMYGEPQDLRVMPVPTKV
jgi:hypothetical protein